MSTAIIHTPVEGPAAYSDEWYALRVFEPERKERPVIFGASEAADCTGHGYRTPLQVYLEKRGEYERQFSDDQTERMEIGSAIEKTIGDIYKKRNAPCRLKRGLPMYFHPDFAWMAATPDGICARSKGRGHGDEEWGLEIKNSNLRMFDPTGEDTNKYGEEGTDQVPLYILLQTQQQMAVMGLDRVDVPVLAGGGALRVYTVNRNDDLIDKIIEAELDLQYRILRGSPPDPDFTHTSTRKLLSEMYGVEIGRVEVLEPDWLALWQDYQTFGEEIRTLQEARDEVKNKILHRLGTAEVGRFMCDEAEIELHRTQVADSYVTPKKVAELCLRIGQVDRKGHSRLTARRIK